MKPHIPNVKCLGRPLDSHRPIVITKFSQRNARGRLWMLDQLANERISLIYRGLSPVVTRKSDVKYIEYLMTKAYIELETSK